ncbi:DUF1871 family protein [Metabacillus sp. 84]|uniref:DUF1871 family protein n=1 Tax=unclassified Metabacillus TaxID=2675274 RepID=UPI003CF88785
MTDRKKQMKNHYQNALASVGEIVNEWDPADLLAMDCPADEYEAEILRITAAGVRAETAGALAETIRLILFSSFGDEFKKTADCKEIAANILFRIQE